MTAGTVRVTNPVSTLEPITGEKLVSKRLLSNSQRVPLHTGFVAAKTTSKVHRHLDDF
jgi:hypothetical protein